MHGPIGRRRRFDTPVVVIVCWRAADARESCVPTEEGSRTRVGGRWPHLGARRQFVSLAHSAPWAGGVVVGLVLLFSCGLDGSALAGPKWVLDIGARPLGCSCSIFFG